MWIEEYLTLNTDQEMVFRTPAWGRAFFLPFVVFLAWFLYMAATSFGLGSYNLRNWCLFVCVALPTTLVFFVLLLGALPHELRLDFGRGVYERSVGYCPLCWQSSGSLDGIRSTYVQVIPAVQPENRIYQIGVVWRGPPTRSRYALPALLHTLASLMSDSRYRFACSQDARAAEALARKVASRLNVPYDGLLSQRGNS